MSVCFNTKLLIEWRRLSKSGGSTKLSHHEKSLLLYTALVFVATMMLCLQQLMKAFANLTANYDLDLWVTLQFYWVHDVMVCTPPFCLVMLSADLRMDIVNILRCRRHQKSNLVSASVFYNRSTVRT
ncbi:hypothetical protein GCK32_010164 [Trichostrongylus colubriformis]|uniref:Serpentine receptor class gamma n=1 Tax=Trichostrongylus colubriformis TaxID=6319 RepID=A0AAN8FXR9_TRICO